MLATGRHLSNVQPSSMVPAAQQDVIVHKDVEAQHQASFQQACRVMLFVVAACAHA